jgi:MFS family permease
MVRGPRFFYGNVVVAAGFVIWMIGWGTYTPAFSVFLKPLVSEFGWSRAETSLAYSLSFLALAGAGVAMGWLTDKLGPRKVVVALGSFLGICYLLMSQVRSLWQLHVNYIVVGSIGASTLNVPVMVTLSRWFVRKRGLMIGIVQAGSGIGGFVFAPLAGWLILTYGWRNAYIVLGIIALVGMVAAGLLLKRDPKEMGQSPDGENTLTASKGIVSKPALHPPGLPLGETVRTSQFWIIAGLYGSFGFCRSTFTAHLAAHVQDLGFSLTDGANILAVLTGSSMLGRVGMGRLVDIIGSRRVFMISFGVTTLSLVLGLMARDLWALYLFAFIFGFAWGNQAVLRFTLTSEVFGLASLGVVIGLLSVAESVSAMAGVYFAGYVFDVAGNYEIAFWVGIGISVTGIILAGLLSPIKMDQDCGQTFL